MLHLNQYAVFNLKSIPPIWRWKEQWPADNLPAFSQEFGGVNEWIGMRYCVRSGLLSVFDSVVSHTMCACMFLCACRQEEASLAMWARGSDERSQDVIWRNLIPANDNRKKINFTLDLVISVISTFLTENENKKWWNNKEGKYKSSFSHLLHIYFSKQLFPLEMKPYNPLGVPFFWNPY